MTGILRMARFSWRLAAALALLVTLGPLRGGQAAIYINEFMAINDSLVPDELGVYSDWVELYNSSIASESIGGYCLSDNFAHPTKWSFPGGTTIAGGGYLLIFCDGTTVPNPGHTQLHASFRLQGREGERIGLYAADGATTADSIVYGAQAPNVSYGRRTDGSSEWGPFGTAQRPATPGGFNRGFTSPGPLAGKVFINEWMASNHDGIRDDAGQAADWIELYNASDVPIDLSGYYLTDSLANPIKWQIPKILRTPFPWRNIVGNVVGPHDYVVFWADDDEEEGPTHTGFNLNAGMGEELGLYETNGATPIDTLSFGPQWPDVSEGRRPDGAAVRVFYSRPTPYGPNYTPSTPARAWHLYR